TIRTPGRLDSPSLETEKYPFILRSPKRYSRSFLSNPDIAQHLESEPRFSSGVRMLLRAPMRSCTAACSREPASPLVKTTRPEPFAGLNWPTVRKPELLAPVCHTMSPSAV